MWQGISGHDDVVERFRRALLRGRLASTFLFVGPAGVGKHTFALRLAQAFLCQRRPIETLDPCGECESCVQARAGIHPDLLRVARPTDKSFIPLSLLIGDDQHRMRAGLCHDIAMRSFYGGRKVAIIDDADDLNEEGANALLKTLEEPPPGSVLILVGTSADKQLPTIRSRSQIVRFESLDPATIAQLLLAQGLVPSLAEGERLAALAEGSLSRAAELADDELRAFRDHFLAQLGRLDRTSVALARETVEFVDAAGKEAPARRRRLRQIIRLAIEYHRGRLRTAMKLAPDGLPADDRAAEDWRRLTEQAQRSLESLGQVDRNAHQATLIDCWLDDLCQLEAGRNAATEGDGWSWRVRRAFSDGDCDRPPAARPPRESGSSCSRRVRPVGIPSHAADYRTAPWHMRSPRARPPGRARGWQSGAAPTRDKSRSAAEHQQGEDTLDVNLDEIGLIIVGNEAVQQEPHDPGASQQEECVPHHPSARHGQGSHESHGAPYRQGAEGARDQEIDEVGDR